MVVRVCFVFFALSAIVPTRAHPQDAVIYVDVKNHTHENLERSPQDALETELREVKTDALLLYTDFASRAGNDLNTFLRNITGFAGDALGKLEINFTFDETNPDDCYTKYKFLMKKAEHDARRAAIYSGESHHKFLLGHMIVFRMHLNKSEDYLKKCDKVLRECGPPCETSPRVKRWRRLAMEEIHRVRDDMQHSRKSYRDLVAHARRKLNHLRKQAINRAQDALDSYNICISRV
ncbi:uncharacterized protein LOC142976697 [Anticarsia gemmatalis]|uniref:uncharacterized protein LOC142976697 n=1 Tax=Anticarsia gemmatalis TaxID=129554 RepID=UPI003F763AA0